MNSSTMSSNSPTKEIFDYYNNKKHAKLDDYSNSARHCDPYHMKNN